MNIDAIMRVAPVIPVIVIEDEVHAVPLAEALVAGGLRVLEVTLRTPAALSAIRAMKQVEGAIVGAGTVTNPRELDAALEAGSEFIVSPGLTDNLGKAAIAAGVPDDKMPVVTVRDEMFTPSTFNTEKATARALELFTGHFGEARVVKTPAVMAGEDFSRFWLADKSVESLIFWVGGTPKPLWDAAGGNQQKLPSLHSPFWAPDAEAVISTATEAMTVAALDILKKS